MFSGHEEGSSDDLGICGVESVELRTCSLRLRGWVGTPFSKLRCPGESTYRNCSGGLEFLKTCPFFWILVGTTHVVSMEATYRAR